MEKSHSCVDCAVRACRGKGGVAPDFCLTNNLDSTLLSSSVNILSGEDNALAVAAAQNEYDGYGTRCRIEEVMHLAKLMGIHKLGIATCVGLLTEARQLTRVLRAHGYKVYGVACKCGTIAKTTIGVDQEAWTLDQIYAILYCRP